MPNHDTFLAGICANPDDDAPRLVYADWLEENGDGDRAEFIRTQIELARTDEKQSGYDRLLRRQKLLLAKHRKAWTAPLRVIAERMEFARGFVMTLTLPAKRFIDHAAMLFELAPIRSVVLTHSVNYTIDLAVCPNLSRLTSISFQSISATAQAIVAALTDPPSPRDVAVPIVDDRIGDTGFAEFLASPYLPSLAWLHVPSQNLSVAAVGSLALAPAAQNLRRLDLSHNRIGDEGVARICASTRLQNLEWLNLANAEIGVTLNEMLGFLLSRVRRRATETTVSTVRALADPSVLPKLRYLNLRGNRVNEADRRALRARFGANVHI